MAASGGHLGVVRVLVSEFKADVNACTNNSSTPLDMAVNNNREDVALALINEFHCDTKGVHLTYTQLVREAGSIWSELWYKTWHWHFDG